jgi:hypothetical protein
MLVGTCLAIDKMYDFFVAPAGQGGSPSNPGTFESPWTMDYAMEASGAQAAGKLPTTGARVGVRGKSNGTVEDYHFTDQVLDAHGSVGSGVDADDGKLIFEGFRSGRWAKPERARIFGDLVGGNIVDYFMVDGNYVQMRFLEFSHDWNDRNNGQNAGSGIWMRGTTDGFKVIHCIFRDCSNGIFSGAGDASDLCTGRHEIYGSDFRNNGWDLNGTPGSSAHGMYLHHHLVSGARFRVEENICGPTFANCCQLYHSGGYTEGIDYNGNVHYLAASLSSISPTNWHTDGTMVVFGSESGGRDIVANDVFCFWPDTHGDCAIVAPYATSTNKITIVRAYCVGGGSGFGLLDLRGTYGTQADFTLQDGLFRPGTAGNRRCVRVSQAGNPLGYVWSGNLWVRDDTTTSWRHGGSSQNWATFKTNSGLGSTDTQQDADPTVTRVFVRPTKRYRDGMGNVIIYNWESLTDVDVDLSSILGNGDLYDVYDARDRVTPILSGTYDGSPVAFPMDTQKTDPAPIGGFVTNGTPPDTVPAFNAFVVWKRG